MKTKRFYVCTITLVILSLFVGYGVGAKVYTNAFPMLGNHLSVSVPDPSQPTLEEVLEVLRDMPEKEYGFGYNCLDFSNDDFSALKWAGYRWPITKQGAIEHEIPPHDAIIVVNTSDKGRVFIEPQMNIVVYPKVGEVFNGVVVTRILTYRQCVDEVIE